MNELLKLHAHFRRFCCFEEGLSIRTVKAMESTFKTFLKRTGVETLNQMSEEKIREFFYEGREAYQWSASNYSNYHKYLLRFSKWCIERGYRKDNPLEKIKKPKFPQALPRRLKEIEAKSILYESLNYDWRYKFERVRNHTIMATFLYSGIRMSELVNLEIQDVNLEESYLLIRHGKGDKDRYVPIHYKLQRILKEYLHEHKKNTKKSTILFTGIHGDKKLNPKDLYAVCKKIGSASGIRFTCHQLRHTFASISIEQGIGIIQLKDILGHSNLASTMIYLKISPKSLSEGMNKLEMF